MDQDQENRGLTRHPTPTRRGGGAEGQVPWTEQFSRASISSRPTKKDRSTYLTMLLARTRRDETYKVGQNIEIHMLCRFMSCHVMTLRYAVWFAAVSRNVVS